MKLRNQKDWDEGVENNDDPYGAAVYRYAKNWANLMESEIDNGVVLEKCAKETSHSADTEGITGFMYGCAVSVLANCWEHGEQLRQWHNLDTQIQDEGEKANATGGTLNPALLNIQV